MRVIIRHRNGKYKSLQPEERYAFTLSKIEGHVKTSFEDKIRNSALRHGIYRTVKPGHNVSWWFSMGMDRHIPKLYWGFLEHMPKTDFFYCDNEIREQLWAIREGLA